jgi:hypothetical protein
MDNCDFSKPDDRTLIRHIISHHDISGVSSHAVQEPLSQTVPATSRALSGVHRSGSRLKAVRSTSPYELKSSMSPVKQPEIPLTPIGSLAIAASRASAPSVQSSPSRVDTHDPAQLDGSICYLLTNPFLTLHSLRVHRHFRTLHCISCNIALLPSTTPGHMRNTHNKTMSTDDIRELDDVLQLHQVLTTTDVQVPPPGGPPVEGLAIQLDGYACSECSACTQTYKTFKNHWSMDHKEFDAPARKSYRKTAIQSFFPTPLHPFAVNPSLASIATSDPFYLYLTQEVPKLKNMTLVPPPTTEKEIPPLLQVTNWHVHLADHISSKAALREVLKLKNLPGLKDDSPRGRLRDVVWKYMQEVRTLARKAPFSVRCILMEWPR